MAEVEELQEAIREFVAERNWEQFHSPKNLSMALAVEVAELMEPFQWMNGEDSRTLSPDDLEDVASEIADVLIYALNLCHQLDVDPARAVRDKLETNREKYPVDQSRGRAAKYTDLCD